MSEEKKMKMPKPPKAPKVKKERPPREHHGHTPLGGLLTRIIIILVLILGILCVWFYGTSKNSEAVVEKNSVMVKESLSFWQEFVTLKYRYSDIVSVKKTGFLTSSYALVKYSGIVRAGIQDITAAEINISSDGKVLTIILPEPDILGNDIVSQEVFDEQHSIFVPMSMEEVFTEINNSKEDALEELLNDGILEQSKDHAKKILTQLFKTAGFEVVVVE
ncbi:MAG: DUF4230 domain-containing protein [Treponema sp.]|nr:DUF4230 domain-containing protein [Treponema sp.]